jgi:serine/threonine-protein kinase
VAHPDARDRTLVALAVQRGALAPGKLRRALALCERLSKPAEEVLPRWVEEPMTGLIAEARLYRYRCGCRTNAFDMLASHPQLRCTACGQPFTAEVQDLDEESTVVERRRAPPSSLEDTIREPARFAPAEATTVREPERVDSHEASTVGEPERFDLRAAALAAERKPFKGSTEETHRDPYRGDREVPLPERIGPFEVEHELGKGAMGSVYLAKHPRGRPVAVKVLRQGADAAALLRFQREIHLGRQLRHPGIVEVLDTGQDDNGQHYLVMDYVPGQTLRAKLEAGPLEPDEARQIVQQAAEAIAFLHGKDVIHRDLKPENLILDPARGRVRITDLGLAREVRDLTLTDTGTIVGTPHYMSPEQLAADRTLDPSADVYALGVILYECLTGATLHPDLTALNLAAVISEEPPPTPRREDRDLPRSLVNVCLRALQPQRADRYPDAGAMAHALASTTLHRRDALASLASLPKLVWVGAAAAAIVLGHLAGTALLRPAQPPAHSPLAAAPSPPAPPVESPSAEASPAPSSPAPQLEGALRALEELPRRLINKDRTALAPEVRAQWEDLLELRPDDSRPWLARACYRLMAKGDAVGARSDAAKALAREPKSPWDMVRLFAHLSWALGFERAAADWTLANHSRERHQIDVAGLLANTEPPVQDLARARALLESARFARGEPDEVARLRQLAFVLLLQGEREAARPLLERARPALGKAPDTVVAQLLSGEQVARLGPIAQQVAQHPSGPLPLLQGSYSPARPPVELARGLGKIGSSQSNLSTSAYALLMVRAARLYQRAGMLRDAETSLTHAQGRLRDAAVAPHDVTTLVHRLLARALLEQGGLDRAGEAERMLQAALELDQDGSTAGELADLQLLLARAQLTLGRRADAQASLDRADAHNPFDRREIETLRPQLGR